MHEDTKQLGKQVATMHNMTALQFLFSIREDILSNHSHETSYLTGFYSSVQCLQETTGIQH
jgi:hypothetical protein